MFLLFSFLVMVITYILKTVYVSRTSTNSKETFWKTSEAKVRGKQVFNDIVFSVYKGPARLRYVRMNKEVEGILEDLDWLEKYQPDILHDLMIYTEYFFKYHYNVMIGKYDAHTYIPIINDLRRLIMNTMSSGTFNLPTISTIVDIQNIDVFMSRKRRDMQAVLTKYINILRHKFKHGDIFEGPYNDMSLETHDLYM